MNEKHVDLAVSEVLYPMLREFEEQFQHNISLDLVEYLIYYALLSGSPPDYVRRVCNNSVDVHEASIQ